MQNAIGNVGGLNKMTDIQLTCQAALYASGNLIGGKISLINAAFERYQVGAILASAVLSCKTALNQDVDLVLFSSDPSGTTFTENAAFSIATADLPKVLGVLTFAAANRKALGTPVVATLNNLNLVLEGLTYQVNSLYGACVIRGAFTPGSTSDFFLRLGISRDM